MLLGIAVVPLVIVLIGTLVLRRPAWQMALVALAMTAIVACVVAPTIIAAMPMALAAGALLAADAAAVIVPGLWLNDLLKRSGAHRDLLDWIASWPVHPAIAVVILTTGFAQALESIAGFGVSLLVTVPVLLRLLPRRQALTAALLSLIIQPWGTAGLATRVAAELTGLDQQHLGTASAVLSSPIFPLFAMAVACIAAPKGQRRRPVLVAASLGVLFSVTLIAVNAIGLVSIAGVTAGAITGMVGYAVAVRKAPRSSPGVPWRALVPYATAVIGILVLRVIDAITGWGTHVAIRAGQITFEPLLCPGIALLAASLWLWCHRPNLAGLKSIAVTASKPVAVLLGFAGTSQIMAASGTVAALTSAISSLGPVGYIACAPLLAVGSGYIVGSGTGANAFMATTQAAIGQPWHALWATALHNSFAGGSVFASAPETTLVLAIAGQGTPAEETMLLRRGFAMLAPVWLFATITATLITLP